MVSKEDREIDVFKGYILGIIDGIDADTLKDLIVQNRLPPILDFDLPPQLKPVVSLIIEYKDDIFAELSYENVLKYAAKYQRYDFLNVINNDDGKRWINNFLKFLKFLFINANLPKEILREKWNLACIKAQKMHQERILEARAREKALKEDRRRREELIEEEVRRATEPPPPEAIIRKKARQSPSIDAFDPDEFLNGDGEFF